MSSRHPGYLRSAGLGPALLRRGINLWPPFLGAGIKVMRIAADYRDIEVTLRLGLLNRNYVGTQFGGSLFAMADPFYMLMMLHNLGPDYVVWDKTGSIEYLKPGRGDVHARFHLPPAEVTKARRATTHGRKYEPTFHVSIVDNKGETIARVSKTLHIRRKPATPHAGAGVRRTRKVTETP
jgi:acyl-coenzyme A thioesterase PaaI-like protein